MKVLSRASNKRIEPSGGGFGVDFCHELLTGGNVVVRQRE